jgi:uncharacterized RDD family membrane protein YckC
MQSHGQPIGIKPRLGAWLIDLCLFVMVAVVLKVAHGESVFASSTRRDPRSGTVVTNHSFNIVLSGWLALVILALMAAYYVVMEARYGGTVGKLARGLRVVMLDGSPLTWRAAAVRTAWRAIDAFPYFLPYFSGAVHVLFTKRKQRLGDRAAHTVVVRHDAVSRRHVKVANGAQPASTPPNTWERR